MGVNPFRQKRSLTDEQKEAMGKRLAAARLNPRGAAVTAAITIDQAFAILSYWGQLSVT